MECFPVSMKIALKHYDAQKALKCGYLYWFFLFCGVYKETLHII